jgi:hypothetical protein
MTIIKDGTGTSFACRVTKRNRLVTEARTSTNEHATNHVDGLAFHLVYEQTPAGANDCFLFMQNKSNTDISLEGMTIRVPTNEVILIYRNPTGIPAGGTSNTPVNNNFGSTNKAAGVFLVGNDITGLTVTELVDRIYVSAGNNTIAFFAVTGGIQINSTLIFNYHGPEEQI